MMIIHKTQHDNYLSDTVWWLSMRRSMMITHETQHGAQWRAMGENQRATSLNGWSEFGMQLDNKRASPKYFRKPDMIYGDEFVLEKAPRVNKCVSCDLATTFVLHATIRPHLSYLHFSTQCHKHLDLPAAEEIDTIFALLSDWTQFPLRFSNLQSLTCIFSFPHFCPRDFRGLPHSDVNSPSVWYWLVLSFVSIDTRICLVDLIKITLRVSQVLPSSRRSRHGLKNFFACFN